MRSFRPTIFLAALAGAGLATSALAQCRNRIWTGEFSTPATGLSVSRCWALEAIDPDGPGPATPELFVGGQFAQAGGLPNTRGLARWDAQRWADVGGGITVPSNASVTGLGRFDPDGSGPMPEVLVAAGSFTQIGGVAAPGVATWNGTTWSPLGQGVVTFAGWQTSFAQFDPDGPGPLPHSLFMAGDFTITGTGDAGVARWDGQAWHLLVGFNSPLALAVYDDDGPGPILPALYEGTDSWPGLYRWDGTTWTPVGGGLRSALHTVASLRVVDEDGPGPARPTLWVGGFFTVAGPGLGIPALNIVRWDGEQWSAIGQGLPSQVESILPVDESGGAAAPVIHAAVVGHGVFRWNAAGQTWSQLGSAATQFAGFYVHQLAALDEDGLAGEPPAIYLAGFGLASVSGVPSAGLARYGCACYANCDGSGIVPALNVNDFICFMNRFAVGLALPPAEQLADFANCDGSTTPPVLNVNDYVCFNNRFASGCP